MWVLYAFVGALAYLAFGLYAAPLVYNRLLPIIERDSIMLMYEHDMEDAETRTIFMFLGPILVLYNFVRLFVRPVERVWPFLVRVVGAKTFDV